MILFTCQLDIIAKGCLALEMLLCIAFYWVLSYCFFPTFDLWLILDDLAVGMLLSSMEQISI